ncbi:MAG TPA: hypothetical protein VGD48_31975 [Kutzneria sp.]|jgi:hypothetical protein
MSTTDDRSTSTPDALDPITVDEVEQALTAVRHGGETTDGGIPQAETTKPGEVAHLDAGAATHGGVARPHGGIPQAETTRPDGMRPLDGGIGQPETENPNRGGVAHPNGGIPQAETVHP